MDRPVTDSNTLLRIKGLNPDLFYKIISELDNSDLLQLPTWSKKFKFLSDEDLYWEKLWRMKFGLSLPAEVKEEYLNRNALIPVVDFIYQHQAQLPVAFQREGKEQIFKLLLKFQNPDPPHVDNITLAPLKKLAIKFDGFDLLLFTLFQGEILTDGDVFEMLQLKRKKMFQKLLKELSHLRLQEALRYLTLETLIMFLHFGKLKDLSLIKDRFSLMVVGIKQELSTEDLEEGMFTEEDTREFQEEVISTFREKVESAIAMAQNLNWIEAADYLKQEFNLLDFGTRKF